MLMQVHSPVAAFTNPNLGAYGFVPRTTHTGGESSPSRLSASLSLSEQTAAGPTEAVPGSPDDLEQTVKRNRFELVPGNGWHHFVEPIGCNASNLMMWDGESPVPRAPHPCWLLPVKDDLSVTMARMQEELREAGWKLLTCDPELIATLCNKSSLTEYAERLGLEKHVPRRWNSAEEAQYPCVLKPAKGEHGKNTWIIKTPEEVNWYTNESRKDWLLQEHIWGCMEYSTSLLVKDGEILDAICMEYEYSEYEYIWPNVRENGKRVRHHIPSDERRVMSALLKGFSGICNFNFKLDVKKDSRMVILECNTRVGGDLVFDAPKDRARKLFEKLDRLDDS